MAISIGDLLAKMGLDISDFTSALNTANQQAQTAASNMKSQFGAIGTAALVAGGAITGAMTGSVIDFTKTGTELDELSDKTGMTVTTLSKLNYVAGQTGTSLDSVQTAAKAMAKNITDLSAINGDPLAAVQKATNGVTDAQNALTVAQMKLSAAQGNNKTTAIQLKEAQDSVATATQKLSTAQDALTTAQSGTTSTAGLAQKAFQQLGLNISDLQKMTPDQQFMTIANALAGVTDETQRSALAQATLGKSATDLLPMLANGSAGLQSMMNQAVDTGTVMTQVQADAALKMTQAMATMKASVSGLAIAIGGALVPMLTEIIDKVTPIVEWMTKWGDAHPKLKEGIVIVVTALGLMLLALGTYIKLMESTTIQTLLLDIKLAAHAIATGVATAAQWLFNAAMDANPIMLVVLAVAALIVGVIEMVKHWDAVLAFFKEAWDWIKEHWPLLVDILLGPIGFVITFVIKNFGKIKDTVVAVWNDVKNFFVAVWNDIKGIFAKYWPEILAIIFPAVGIPILIAQHWDQIKEYFTKLWDDVKAIFTKWVNDIVTWATGIWDKITGAFDTLKTNVKTFFSGLWSDVENIWTGVVTWITTFATGLWDKVVTAFDSLHDDFVNFFTGLWSDIEGIWDTAIDWIIGKVNDVIKLIDKVPGVNIGTIKDIGVSPTIPGQAGGGKTLLSGLSWVGENGPELLNLPKGATVEPLSAIGPKNGPLYANVQIDGYTLMRVMSEYQDREYRGQGNV